MSKTAAYAAAAEWALGTYERWSITMYRRSIGSVFSRDRKPRHDLVIEATSGIKVPAAMTLTSPITRPQSPKLIRYKSRNEMVRQTTSWYSSNVFPNHRAEKVDVQMRHTLLVKGIPLTQITTYIQASGR